MANEDTIKRFSAAELEARRTRGESRTDFARLRAKPDKQLNQDIVRDPDFRDVPENWYEAAEAVTSRSKKLLSLRVDSDVIDWFKRQGPGYQTKMNAVLRAFAEHSEKKRA